MEVRILCHYVLSSSRVVLIPASVNFCYLPLFLMHIVCRTTSPMHFAPFIPVCIRGGRRGASIPDQGTPVSFHRFSAQRVILGWSWIRFPSLFKLPRFSKLQCISIDDVLSSLFFQFSPIFQLSYVIHLERGINSSIHCISFRSLDKLIYMPRSTGRDRPLHPEARPKGATVT